MSQIHSHTNFHFHNKFLISPPIFGFISLLQLDIKSLPQLKQLFINIKCTANYNKGIAKWQIQQVIEYKQVDRIFPILPFWDYKTDTDNNPSYKVS